MDDEGECIARLAEAIEVGRYLGIVNAIDALPAIMPADLAKAALYCVERLADEWAQSSIMMALARHLPDDLFAPALDIADGLHDPDIGNRDHVLVALAKRFPASLHPSILEVARKTENPDDRIAALTRLVPLMPEVLPEAIDLANNPAVHPSNRAWAYAKFAAHDPSLLADALTAIAANPQEHDNVSTLMPLLDIAEPCHIPAIAVIFQAVRTPDLRKPLRAKLSARFPEVLWLR